MRVLNFVLEAHFIFLYINIVDVRKYSNTPIIWSRLHFARDKIKQRCLDANKNLN